MKVKRADVKPLPPHRTFEGWPAEQKRSPIRAPDKTTSFEPSAVVAVTNPRTQREEFVVLNDFYDRTQYHFELDAAGELTAADRSPRALMTLDGRRQDFAPKFEAVSQLPDGRLIATTPFNRPELQQHKVFTFGFAEGRTTDAHEVRFDRAGFEKYIQQATGQPWFQIEGLAVDAAGKNAFFGVRFAGQSREGEKRAMVRLVRMPFDGAALGKPASTLELGTEKVLGRREGLADLQRDPSDGSYLLLTSFEGNDDGALDNMAGHLFRLPADLVEKATSDVPIDLPAPIASFQGKPEGVTAMRDGRLLVIFDDDREWKDNFQGYERRKGTYAVLSSDGAALS